MILTEAELQAIRRQAAAEYPAECCGVVLVRDGACPERLLLPCENAQDVLHAQDPGRHPRDSRTAYSIAAADLLAIGRREAAGFAVHVIYHSHVDVGAYFSETDRRQALLAGEPAYPDATYVVVGVDRTGAREARAFRWDPARRDFAEVALAGAAAPDARIDAQTR